MKKCIKCNERKKLTSFYERSDRKGHYYGTCKECDKLIGKKRYKLNRKYIYQRNLNRRKYLAEEVNKLKNAPCADCGKIFEPHCMDFDHLNNKFMCISKMVHETFSLENIKKEIKKCELVCALCHSNRTYNSQKISKYKYPCLERNKQIIILAKDKPCEICGIKYNTWQMHFDHLKPQNKKANVGTLIGSSEKTIDDEIKKCQVICVMCHRRKTKRDF